MHSENRQSNDFFNEQPLGGMGYGNNFKSFGGFVWAIIVCTIVLTGYVRFLLQIRNRNQST